MSRDPTRAAAVRRGWLCAAALAAGSWAMVACHGRPVGPTIDSGGGTGGPSSGTGGRSGGGGGGLGGTPGTGGVGAGPGTGGAGSGGAPGMGGTPGTGGAPGSGGTSGTGGMTGTGGTRGTGGVPGTGGTPGTGGVTGTGGAPGSGGTPGSGGRGSGGTGTGGTTVPCVESSFRGSCPNPEFCFGGVWSPNTQLQCGSCGIVDCPPSRPNCCGGFRAGALTARDFQPNPDAIISFTAGASQVVVDFNFGEPYEIGAVDLLLSAEMPIYPIHVDIQYDGDVYPDFSMERGTGDVGAVYALDTFGDVVISNPMFCFPTGSPCHTTVNQMNIRLRPRTAGPARLTVTGITIAP